MPPKAGRKIFEDDGDEAVNCTSIFFYGVGTKVAGWIERCTEAHCIRCSLRSLSSRYVSRSGCLESYQMRSK